MAIHSTVKPINMKHLSLILITYFFTYKCLSQTTLGILSGLEYTTEINIGVLNIDKEIIPYNSNGDYADSNMNSFFGGLRVEQHFSNVFYVSAVATYSKKHFQSFRTGFSSLNPIISDERFHFYNFSFLVNWSPLKNMYMGIGSSHGILSNVTSDNIEVAKRKNELSIVTSISYRYKGFLAELQYRHGLQMNEGTNDTLFFLSPMRALSLSFGYVITIISPQKWQKSSRTDCPKF